MGVTIIDKTIQDVKRECMHSNGLQQRGLFRVIVFMNVLFFIFVIIL